MKAKSEPVDRLIRQRVKRRNQVLRDLLDAAHTLKACMAVGNHKEIAQWASRVAMLSTDAARLTSLVRDLDDVQKGWV